MSDWFRTGEETQKTMSREVKQTEQKKVQQNIPRKFYLKEGTSKNILFVDDSDFLVYEHGIKINGRYEQYTCKGEKNGCKFSHKWKPVPKVYSTVIDCDGWVNQRGEVKDKNQKMLFPATSTVYEILKSIKMSFPDKTLVGCMFQVTRKVGKDSSTGSVFKLIKKFNAEAMKAKHQPFNYSEILKPVSDEAAQEIIDMTGGNNPSALDGLPEESISKGEEESGKIEY